MKTALDFYTQAFIEATSEAEREQLHPYLKKTDMVRQIALMSDPETRESIPLREETEEITRQRRLVDMALTLKCFHLSEAEPIKGISSLKEMDFRLQQELTNAGWVLFERDGRVVIYSYLPTRHQRPAIPA